MSKELKTAPKNKYKLSEILAALTTDQRKKIIDKIIDHGVSYDTISRIRRAKSGDKYTPTADTFRVIADVLNISMEKLFNVKL